MRKDDEFEIDVVENISQFIQVVLTSVLVGTAHLLKGVREMIERP